MTAKVKVFNDILGESNGYYSEKVTTKITREY
jgi:hypothetical protein